MILHTCKRAVLSSACMFLLIPSLSLAEIGGVTIDDVIARAVRESPTMQAIEARAATKRAEGITLNTLQNPTLDAEVRVPSSYRVARGGDEVNVTISQPLRPSDFRLRGRINALIQSAADSEQSAEVLAFSQQLRLAYVKAWALERRSRELTTFSTRATALEKAVNAASASGFVAAGEAQLLRAETIKARYQLVGISADAVRARSQLSKSAGFAVTSTLAQPEIKTLPTTSELVNSQTRVSTLDRAQLGVKLAKEQLMLAKLDSYPRFAPRLVYERTGDYTNYFGVGLSIDLPFFDRNQGERVARYAEADSAQRLNAYLRSNLFESEVEGLHSSIVSATRLINGFTQEILPALQSALSAEERQLKAGQGSPFRVWQILKEVSLSETEALEKTVGAHADRAELAILTGVDF